MSEEAAQAVAIPADQVDFLIATAARAPSVHNTQPWRFRVREFDIELYADTRRKLQTDPLGREMLISCGAALFGLRLAVRSLGYLPVVELLPDRDQLRLLARVGLGTAAPMTAKERQMLEALPHRHTHRGPFDPGPLPAGLLAGLQHDAFAEGATLAPVDPGIAYQRRPGQRCCSGAEPPQIPPGTASPRTRSPPVLVRSGGGCRSVTSTWAVTWGCCQPVGRRPPSPQCC